MGKVGRRWGRDRRNITNIFTEVPEEVKREWERMEKEKGLPEKKVQ